LPVAMDPPFPRFGVSTKPRALQDQAEEFFENGLGDAFKCMREAHNAEFPLTLFYAFKQAESETHDLTSTLVSTGWETMLTGLLEAGFGITGTWPMRSEMGNRAIAVGKNALASSVVLVCRPREPAARVATRREFVSALRSELPTALKNLQQGNIAPVDLAQASIGPGMAVFSRFAKVLEAEGNPMRVRAALGLINQVLDEVLSEQESEYDPATRWAIAWFDQFGVQEGPFGLAETLSKAKNISVAGLLTDGFLWARGGRVRLLGRNELPDEWDPVQDPSLSVWELTQHLIKRLDEQGEAAAAALLRRAPSHGEIARDLAYRLYNACERKKWAQEAIAYNSLVVAWPELTRLAEEHPGGEQGRIL
jgi:putative DNA methylase